MANSLDMRIAEEGPRNAIVKLTGVLDTSDITETPAISLSDFNNNDPNLNLAGLRVDMIEYSIGGGIQVLLEWNSMFPEQIFPLSGRGCIRANNYGGFLPDQTITGYDGNINLKTTGFGVGAPEDPIQNFTVVLELIKLYTS